MGCFLYVASDSRMRDRAQRVGRISDVRPTGTALARRQVAMVSWEGHAIDALALLTRGMTVASYKIGFRLTDFLDTEPIDLDELAASLGPPHDRRLNALKANGGALPDDTAQALADAFDGPEPGPWRALEELAATEPAPLWPADRVPVVAYEREAVGLALSLAGLDREDVLRTWDGDTEAPFLTSLRAYRAMEDSAIAHDAQVFGDWTRLSSSVTGATRFEQRGRRLTVLNVNRQEIEGTLGCDLVYYVHRYDAYILVQYKRLTRAGGGDWQYRPDAQLEKELARMRGITTPSTPATTPNEYRLGEGVSFLKFCKGEIGDPLSGELARGMYVPLDLWDRLESGGKNKGQRGGRLVSFDRMDRYLTNTDFVALVQRAWIGSRGVTSKEICTAIEAGLAAGDSLILAAGDSHPTRAYRRPRG